MASSILQTWQRLEKWPLGRTLFGWALRLQVPYAASIRPQVLALAPGHARVLMRDRRAVRNHLSSVHAAALFHLAEVTGNLALSALQPPSGRWIVRGVDVDFVKKARGALTGECAVAVSDWATEQDVEGEVLVRDASGEVVAKARPRWRIGPGLRAA